MNPKNVTVIKRVKYIPERSKKELELKVKKYRIKSTLRRKKVSIYHKNIFIIKNKKAPLTPVRQSIYDNVIALRYC